jgi:manganese oxidase
MGGEGPFGSVEMGGMFTVVKVRPDQKPGDYRDPGWYRHPKGTQAYEWTGALAEPTRAVPARPAAAARREIEVQVRKPTGHGGHTGH